MLEQYVHQQVFLHFLFLILFYQKLQSLHKIYVVIYFTEHSFPLSKNIFSFLSSTSKASLYTISEKPFPKLLWTSIQIPIILYVSLCKGKFISNLFFCHRYTNNFSFTRMFHIQNLCLFYYCDIIYVANKICASVAKNIRRSVISLLFYLQNIASKPL